MSENQRTGVRKHTSCLVSERIELLVNYQISLIYSIGKDIIKDGLGKKMT